MKINKFLVPVSITAALAGMVACAVGCAKKSNAPQTPTPPPAAPVPTNSVTDNTASVVTNTPPETPPVVTNTPPATAEITNSPPAETTTKAPETTPATDTGLPGHNTVVDMSTNPPAAPSHFYPPTMSSNSACCLMPAGLSGTNFYVALRGGYDHINHGDNNDSYWASIKLYAFGDDLRADAGKNAWLIPDSSLEVYSGDIAKPDNNPHPGSDSGFGFRADFTWPWWNWTANSSANPNSYFPFAQPLSLALGPTVNLGFDHLYDEYKYRFAEYAGLRLTINRTGYIEYTVGNTIGLGGTRQQVVAELPFYESHDGEVRYYFRGLWNRGSSIEPDILEGGVFVEMPLGLLVTPGKWGDLVPFAQ